MRAGKKWLRGQTDSRAEQGEAASQACACGGGVGIRETDAGWGWTDGGGPRKRTDRLRGWGGKDKQTAGERGHVCGEDRQGTSRELRTDGRPSDGRAGAAREAGARPRARAVAARAGGGGRASAVFVELSAAVEL